MFNIFNPNKKCRIWEEPVGSLSFGGPDICPSCDCGNFSRGRLKDMNQEQIYHLLIDISSIERRTFKKVLLIEKIIVR